MSSLTQSKKTISNTKLALGIATAMLGSYAGRVHAGSCTAPTPASVCTGAVTGGDVTQVLTAPALSVTTSDDFGIITSAGNALNLSSPSAGLTFNDGGSANSIIGESNGLFADSLTNGSITITSTGHVEGRGYAGFRVRAFAESSDITIAAKDAIGTIRAGVDVSHYGTGSTSIITSGEISSTNFNGINTVNITSGAATTIETLANVTGEINGIHSLHIGSGDLSITVGSDSIVQGINESGILALNYGTANLSIISNGAIIGNNGLTASNSIDSQDVIIETGDVIATENDGRAISIKDSGSGNITISSTGTIDADDGAGIVVTKKEHLSSKGGNITINTESINSYRGAINVENDDGEIAITTGSVSAYSYPAILVKSTSSKNVSINTVDVNGSTGIGVTKSNAGTTSITSTGTITSEGLFSDYAGISVVHSAGAGDITINPNEVSSSYGSGINVQLSDSRGAATITLDGNISAGEDGIKVRSTGGNGLITITGSGNIFGNDNINSINGNNDGIDIETGAEVLINVNGNIKGDPGILINSINGPINITGTGDVNSDPGNGIEANITGAGATGDITIAQDGEIMAKGAANGIVANNAGSGDIFITVNKNVDPDTGTGINTSTDSGTSNVTLNSGANVSGGIVNNAGDSITTVNVGASVSGVIELGEGSDDLTFNGGDFSGVTRIGNDGGGSSTNSLTFQNTGVDTLLGANVIGWKEITINGGSTIMFSDNTLTVGRLNNAGTLNTQDATLDDAMTITGFYDGKDGTLALDVHLGDDASQSDKLVIVKDSTGNTFLSINNIGGTGAETDDGILVVQVNGSSDGNFSLATPVRAGDYLYDLVKVSKNWYLQSTFSLAPHNIPTLSEWGQILLVSLLGIFGLFGTRRRGLKSKT